VKVTERGKEWACVKLRIRRHIQFTSAFLGRFPYGSLVLHVLTVLLRRCLLLGAGTIYWYFYNINLLSNTEKWTTV